MLRLSKKADYGLLALRHLGMLQAGKASPMLGAIESGAAATASAREIAAAYGIPEAILAKILQQLKAAGLVDSRQGKTGGYALTRHPDAINVREVIEAVEGPLTLVSCNFSDDEGCDQFSLCGIKRPLERLNEKVMRVLGATSLQEICE